jgi:hypothetical protein
MPGKAAKPKRMTLGQFYAMIDKQTQETKNVGLRARLAQIKGNLSGPRPPPGGRSIGPRGSPAQASPAQAPIRAPTIKDFPESKSLANSKPVGIGAWANGIEPIKAVKDLPEPIYCPRLKYVIPPVVNTTSANGTGLRFSTEHGFCYSDDSDTDTDSVVLDPVELQAWLQLSS